MKILPIILSGGSGTRLWPLSRSDFPKQLQSLNGDSSLLQQTVKRLDGMDDVLPPVIICNNSQRFLVAQQLCEINIDSYKIILEPEGRNTAPAITVGALCIENPKETIMVVMSSDHYIDDVNNFRKDIQTATKTAVKDYLVTIGIKPTKPHTGFGYIQKGKILDENNVFEVENFTEKPNLETAKRFLKENNYVWNAGIFVFNAESFLNELKLYNPDIFDTCKKSLEKAKKDFDFIRLDKDEFSKAKNISVDYAVMEKSKKVAVIESSFKWSDVGNWNALYDLGKKDKNNNVISGDVMVQNVNNSYIRSEKRLVTAYGLDDIIIIETSDVVFVAPKNKSEEVKSIVEKLKKNNRDEAVEHKKVYRPWGYYESIDSGNRFQVKRIMVRPNEKLSLQKHKHRSEHWVVVEGEAKVVCGDSEKILTKDQSIYIPLETVHQLENVGDKNLYLIEVQSGDYLGEDDIIRLDDIYGRLD